MKALTLTQPWATLVAFGAKGIETRSWGTSYRGSVAIHAAKGFPREAIMLCHQEPFKTVLKAAGIRVPNDLPRGAIVAIADIVDCASTSVDSPYYPSVSNPELPFGDYGPDRWMWILANVRPLAEPIPCRGALSLWQVPSDVLALLNAQTARAS